MLARPELRCALRLLGLMFSAQRLLLVAEEIWPNAGNVKRSFASKGLS